MSRYEKIKEAIENMNTSDIVALHNEYCNEYGDMDYYVYSMDEFDEVMADMKPWDIARSAFFGGFRPVADYFSFNGYGNLVSFDYWNDEDARIYPSEIARYIDENDNSLYNNDIQEILDEYDETEDSDE